LKKYLILLTFYEFKGTIMRLLVWMFCTMTLLFAGNTASQHLSEKLIVHHSKNETNAQEELLKLKVYFIETAATRKLQEKYNLQLDMEFLGDYHMVVIKPINSLALRNELLIVLTPVFQDIFFINYKEPISSIIKKPKVSQVLLPRVKNKIDVSFVNEIGLQWLALLLLSLVGLLLSIASRRKIIHLGNKQKDLKQQQTDIETEIKKLGLKNA